ncbi:MAG: NADH dehydrogenase subunit [Bdellovibrio sp.]|nr:MAG: NADH dehydrogenase subunit [Bdellovibrio sp.]
MKCTINGKELEVKEGTTIIKAMTDHNMRIAHYCWHPGLSVAGVCRLCMVEIEGNPRVQIACNTQITEGMKINNTSQKVKEAAKWGLDFHLINHPLDCPICDQAGECGLQDQYMEFGKYDPEMAEKKVKKHKVVDLGPRVVLDSERCILCSRCVRFTDEVSKTHELGIFNRGDRSEIGTHAGKKLDNNYSLNTVDICPVGALTSKDFRFRQRVWYLKDADTVCNGCSTGCHIKVYFNKEGLFRVRPVYSEVNGHWMCDEGRDLYKSVNKDVRMLKGRKNTASSVGSGGAGWEEMAPGAAAADASAAVKSARSKAALVLTGQYSNDELETMVTEFIAATGSRQIFHWVDDPERMKDFDNVLLRGDRNPNTRGLSEILQRNKIDTRWSQLLDGIKSKSATTVVVAGPENPRWCSSFDEKVKQLGQAQNLIWMQSCSNEKLAALKGNVWLVPMKSYIEKDGSFTNHAGTVQYFKRVTLVVPEALTLSEAARLLAGKALSIEPRRTAVLSERDRPGDRVMLEHRKKNEFVFRRGSL